MQDQPNTARTTGNIDHEIYEKAGLVIEKALGRIITGEMEANDEWLDLAMRWLALPKFPRGNTR